MGFSLIEVFSWLKAKNRYELAFIGTAINNGTDSSLLLKLCSSMRMFIFGVLSVAIASGITYLAGLADSKGKVLFPFSKRPE